MPIFHRGKKPAAPTKQQIASALHVQYELNSRAEPELIMLAKRVTVTNYKAIAELYGIALRE